MTIKKPRLFIGSSGEHLAAAYAVQENLDHDAEVTVWSQGFFQLSQSTLGSLIHSLKSFDFAAFIFAPDDVATIRGLENRVPRDNVIFELGLFMGALGPGRVFFIVPRGGDAMHLPTDLLGVTPATYDPGRSDANLVAALGAACNQLRKIIHAAADSGNDSNVVYATGRSDIRRSEIARFEGEVGDGKNEAFCDFISKHAHKVVLINVWFLAERDVVLEDDSISRFTFCPTREQAEGNDFSGGVQYSIVHDPKVPEAGLSYLRGTFRLTGHFAVSEFAGPWQGIMAVMLRVVPTESVIGR